MNFSLRRMLAVLSIRNKEFYRDLGALGWVFAFPLLVIIALCYMFNLDTSGNYKVGVFNSNEAQIKSFQFISYESKEKAIEKLSNQQLDLVIEKTDQDLRYWKASGSPKSYIAEQILKSHYASGYSVNLIPTDIKGKNVSYVDWLFPGLLGMNVLWMALWGVGWVIVRQRKIGVLKRFKASPVTAFEYLLAQMLSRLIVLSVSGSILFAGAHLVYPFQTQGSYLDILIIYNLGCLSLSSVGLIFAARISSEEFCNGMLNLITYPMMFLSEVWFTLEGSSEFVKSCARFSPLWHMTTGMRKIMQEGVGLMQLKESILILVLTTIVFTSIGAFLFKWTKD